MDKSLIIKRIKSHLNIKSDTDFADFLGVKQPTISSWKARNTLDYELIIAKCNDIDANWLITGEGEMLKNTVGNMRTDNDTIAVQKKLIAMQEKEIARLEKELSDIKSRHKADQGAKRPTTSRVATPEEKLTK